MTVARTSGTNAENGDVESTFVALMVHRGQKGSHVEFFAVEQPDAALARFQELSASLAP